MVVRGVNRLTSSEFLAGRKKFHLVVVRFPLLTFFASILSPLWFFSSVVHTARLRDSFLCLLRGGVRGLWSSVVNPLDTQGGTPELGGDG